MTNGKSVSENTEAPPPNYQDEETFELALGRFMIAWADAEAEVYRVLVAYSGVTNAVARAIFSGLHAKTMTDFIQHIAHNTNMAEDRRQDLEYVFPQLAAINTMRDHLAHHTTGSYNSKDAKTRVVANMRSNRFGKNKGYEISADTINAMTWDLYGIANHLNMHHGRRTGPFTPWREASDDDAPTPWTYKSPQPIKNWETSPSDHRTSLHPPKP